MKSQNRILLIVVIIIIILCCLCSVVSIVVGGIYAYPGIIKGTSFSNTTTLTPSDVVQTPNASSQQEAPTVQASPSKSGPRKTVTGLGVTMDEMIQFYTSTYGLEFDKPSNTGVRGDSSTICFKDECASVTLLGSQDNPDMLALISVIDPNDKAQEATGINLIKDTILYFSGQDKTFSNQISQEILQAQSQGQQLTKSEKVNGYTVTINYTPADGMVGVTISKKP